jgi:WD40 repeat protein
LRQCDHPGPVNDLIVSDDGQKFLSHWGVDVNNMRKGGASRWDAERGREIRRSWNTSILDFSPDSKWALTSTSSDTLWNSETGETVREFA